MLHTDGGVVILLFLFECQFVALHVLLGGLAPEGMYASGYGIISIIVMS